MTSVNGMKENKSESHEPGRLGGNLAEAGSARRSFSFRDAPSFSQFGKKLEIRQAPYAGSA